MSRLPRFMTQKAFAAHLGKSPQYVNKLVGQGKIVLVGRKVNVRQAKAVIAANRRPGRVIPAAASRRRPSRKAGSSSANRVSRAGKAPSATQNLTANRARYEGARAQTAELELARLTRALLPAAEVLEAERRKNANVRARFRRLARSMAPLLHRAASPAEVEQLLLRDIDLVLSELARDPLGVEDQVTAMPEPQSPKVSRQLPVAEMAVAL